MSNGLIQVNNSGFQNTPGGKLTAAVGKAKQVSGGKLEVSFFGPFYSPYWIVNLFGSAKERYQVAVVWSCSSTSKALWILSRTPKLPAGITLDGIYSGLNARGVDVASLDMIQTNHTGCSN